MDTGGGSFTYQFASAQLPQGRTVSGCGKDRLRAGTELLFLPGSLRRLSYRCVSGGGGLVKVQLLLLYHRFPHFAGSPAGTLHLRFSVPHWLVSGAAAQIPTKKLSTKRLKPLRYLKYAILLVMVFLLPAFLVNDVGMGDPFFCKYLCPQGVLEGAIPLSLANSGIRAALGSLFTWKFGILLAVIVLSVLFYRPFCKWLCPLGAFCALLNKASLFQMKVDKNKCVSCGKCARACKMDVDVTKTPNHTECIRCGMCIRACPTNAVCFRYGFGDGKDKAKAAETLQTNNNNKPANKKSS